MCNSLEETVVLLLAAFSVFEGLKEIIAINHEDEKENADLAEQWEWYIPRFYRIWLNLLTDIAGA